MKYSIILLAALLFNPVFCPREKSPLAPAPNNGNGQLIITTDKNSYSWQQGESDFTITIQGTLENRSETTYYSQVGDGFAPPEQEQLFFAGNSAGRIEKYEAADQSWQEINILGFLIEGARIVPLKPAQVYSIHAHLARKSEAEEKGKYRLRIDYYDNDHPGEDEMPLKDYSNVFEIR